MRVSRCLTSAIWLLLAVAGSGGAAAQPSPDPKAGTVETSTVETSTGKAGKAEEKQIVFVATDRATLEAIRDQGLLQRDPQPTSLTAYLSFLLRRLRARLYRALISTLSHVTSITSVLRWAGQILVWGAAVLVFLGLAVPLSRLFTRQRTAEIEETLANEKSAAKLARGAAAWLATLENRLAAGDLSGALEAAWWWLARSLAAERVDPAWTSRELLEQAHLERSRRRQLLPIVRQLDTLVYGPRPPRADEVRGFADQLAAVLATPPAATPQAATPQAQGSES